MTAELKRDPDLEWLDHVQPVGLVVAPIMLKELGLSPSRQTQADTALVGEQIDGDSTKPALHEPWQLFAKVLGWLPQHVDGSPGGRDLPNDLYVKLPEHDTTLSPTWAVRELDASDRPWQMLVRVEPMSGKVAGGDCWRYFGSFTRAIAVISCRRVAASCSIPISFHSWKDAPIPLIRRACLPSPMVACCASSKAS
jgi:hypothetical protein